MCITRNLVKAKQHFLGVQQLIHKCVCHQDCLVSLIQLLLKNYKVPITLSLFSQTSVNQVIKHTELLQSTNLQKEKLLPQRLEPALLILNPLYSVSDY